MVQPVEGLGAELDVVTLGNRKRLEQRQVPVAEAGTIIEILGLIRESPGGRGREDRRTVGILDAEPVITVRAAVGKPMITRR
jgi:hypothetical protein